MVYSDEEKAKLRTLIEMEKVKLPLGYVFFGNGKLEHFGGE